MIKGVWGVESMVRSNAGPLDSNSSEPKREQNVSSLLRSEEYESFFRRQLGRDPSKEDVTTLYSMLVLQAIKNDVRLNDTPTLEDAVRKVQIYISSEVSREDYLSVIGKMNDKEKEKFAEENKRVKELEKKEREEKRIAFEKSRGWRIFKNTVGTVLLLGIFGGAGAVTYEVIHDPFFEQRKEGISEQEQAQDAKYLARVTQLESSYTMKREELERKFFGPFEGILAAETSSIPKNERSLYFQLHFHLGLDQLVNAPAATAESGSIPVTTFYDKTKEGVRLTATRVIESVGSNKIESLYLLKFDKEGNIINAHSYMKSVDNTLGIMGEYSPMKSLFFINDKTVIVDFPDKVVKEMKDTKAFFVGDDLEAYSRESEKFLSSFSGLYGKGPHPETVK